MEIVYIYRGHQIVLTMAICFKLLDKQTGETISLNRIDESICNEVLNVPVDVKSYGGGYVDGGFNWYDTIGFQIAAGKALGSVELRDHYLKSDLWAEEAPVISSIMDFLEAHYTSYSFYGR